MAYLYNMDVDLDVDVREVWDASGDHEKEELKDLVLKHFDIPMLNVNATLADAVIVATKTEGTEAKEYVKRVIEDLEYRLKMRDFS